MMRYVTAWLSVVVLALLVLAPAQPVAQATVDTGIAAKSGMFPMPKANPSPELASAKACPPTKVDFCHLKGAVYLETVESFADYRVFVDEDDRFADLVVFRENARSFCTDGGLWYFVNNRAFADFTVAYTEVQGMSDFSIHLTPFKSLAGCHQ